MKTFWVLVVLAECAAILCSVATKELYRFQPPIC